MTDRAINPLAVLASYTLVVTAIGSSIFVLVRARNTGDVWLAGAGVVCVATVVYAIWLYDRLLSVATHADDLRNVVERAAIERRDTHAAATQALAVIDEFKARLDQSQGGWRVPYHGLRYTPIGTVVVVRLNDETDPHPMTVRSHDPDGFPIVGPAR